MSPVVQFSFAVLAFALVAAGAGSWTLVAPAAAQPAVLTKEQSAAVGAYDTALRAFRAVLADRRKQIDGKKKLPNLPGQAVYLARLRCMPVLSRR
jgi:hypothetical protein